MSCTENPTEPHEAILTIQTDKAVYPLASDSAAQGLLINHGPAVVYAPMNE